MNELHVLVVINLRLGMRLNG